MHTEKQTIFKPSSARQKSTVSSRTPRWLFAAGAALIALLLFVYYVWTWRNLSMFRIAMDSCSEPVCVLGDFANYYYPMGEAIFRTGLLIKGFVHSPFIAILLAVFPPLGLDTSLLLWCILG